MVAREGGLGLERIDDLETRRRTECHGIGDRPIHLYDRGLRELGERIVERRDARPVRLFRDMRARVASGDRGLERIRSEEHTSELQSLAYLVCRLLLGSKSTRLNSSH